MEIAEVFLGAFISMLFDRLAPLELLKLARVGVIDSQLNKCRKTLGMIQKVLIDAEKKQITDESVKEWLNDLQDSADDLEDVVDELATEASRRKLTAADREDDYQEASTSRKARELIHTYISNLNPRAILSEKNMSSKIDEITARLQDIAQQKDELGLKEIARSERSSDIQTSRAERLPTTSLVPDRVYGRNEDRDAILELVLRSGGDQQLCVIPIIGMGGIGKTTLAQLVYNDDKVKDCFADLRSWVCVSDDFDVFRVTKTVLECISKEACNFTDLSMLQEELKEKLSRRRFLLVLDDVWNEIYEKWDLLRRPFLAGAPGSKIITTTRNIKVVSIMSSLSVSYRLEKLKSDDCLSLLAQHALDKPNFDEHPELKQVGEEIVKKCDGLPLAVKALGGLLREQEKWTDVLNSQIWDLPDETILPALRLSYHHLSSHSKRCFAYCSIFPKDYEFDKDELVLLWMAVGLLAKQADQRMNFMTLEDFGRKCFDDLLSRSFFQQSSGIGSRFVMHDLINDLAQFVAGEICFSLGEDSFESTIGIASKISERARHMSYSRQKYEVFRKFKDLDKVRRLRTFLSLPVHKLLYQEVSHISNRVLLDVLPKLQCLRVLSLSGYSISQLPDSIGDLKHLRYLNLSSTKIRCLPESVSALYNLQTLSVSSCNELCQLPESIGNLVNLRHLDNAYTSRLQEMPSGIGKLTSLQTLSKLAVGKNSGLRIRDLKNLLLRGTLTIVGLDNVMIVRDAEEANLKHKCDLDELNFEWSDDFDHDSRKENLNLEMDVLDMLQPHENLTSLEINFYGGMKFPDWFGDPLFSKIVNISLIGCKKCTFLPPLGQLPMLKHLCIRGMHGLKSVGVEFFYISINCPLKIHFPSLETLRFEDMTEWEEWSCCSIGGEDQVEGQFPRLRELVISKCPKLIRFPKLRLPSLHQLELLECNGVVLKGLIELTSLTTLIIERVLELVYLHEEFVQFLMALERLEVRECDELVTLWQSGISLQNLVRLRHLTIILCKQFVSLGEEEQGLPPNLEVLRLIFVENLVNLPNKLNSITTLNSLCIGGCPKLVSFSDTGVPPMLRCLGIGDCPNLESLPNGISHIQVLEIYNCSSLRSSSWPTSNLPSTLKIFHIQECMHLESVAEKAVQQSSMSLEGLTIYGWHLRTLLECVHNFASLVSLDIHGCVVLESFPERALPTPNLRSLHIQGCQNLKSLTDQMRSLKSLDALFIRKCPSLESFPKGNWPPNLTLLEILDCEKVKPLSKWRLHRLTSLRKFSFEIFSEGICSEVVFFSNNDDDDDECLLPSTLTSLTIQGLQNLESLSKGFQNLSSLQDLSIHNCPKLKSLSNGFQNLTSLQHLSVYNCPNLRSLPKEDMLLDTLSSLAIRKCPLLKQRCLKIADIPCVEIDD